MTALPSASGLKYAMRCNGQAKLPKVASVSDHADNGNLRHEYLAAALVGDSERAADVLARMPAEVAEECRLIDLSSMPRFMWVQTEVAYVYNPIMRTARIIGNDIGRDYLGHGWKPTDEFPGTADFVGVTEDGNLTVGDWKTGNAYTVEAAKDNWQLAMLAVAALTTHNVEQQWLREGGNSTIDKSAVDVLIVRTKGELRFDRSTFDSFDLESFRQDLRALAEYIRDEKAEPRLVSGAHCRWCPSFDYCPVQTNLIRSLALKPNVMVDESSELLTPENAAMAYARYRVIKQAMRRIEQQFQQYARRQPIALPDGKVYGIVETPDTRIDPAVALAVLTEKHGREVAIKAMTLETSKAGIDRAIAPLAERGMKAGMVREALAAIQQRGGVTTVMKQELRERDE
jgi:hypothetical protein